MLFRDSARDMVSSSAGKDVHRRLRVTMGRLPPFVLFLKRPQSLVLKKFRISEENFKSNPQGRGSAVRLGFWQTFFRVALSSGNGVAWPSRSGEVYSITELVRRTQQVTDTLNLGFKPHRHFSQSPLRF